LLIIVAVFFSCYFDCERGFFFAWRLFYALVVVDGASGAAVVAYQSKPLFDKNHSSDHHRLYNSNI